MLKITPLFYLLKVSNPFDQEQRFLERDILWENWKILISDKKSSIISKILNIEKQKVKNKKLNPCKNNQNYRVI